MLCYQSSRNATDIIHDTFRWLRDNGRVIRVTTMILLPLSLVVQYLCNSEDYMKRRDLDDMLFAYYFPSFEDIGYAGMVKVCQGLFLFIAVMCIVPILRHYFLSRKSVKRITLGRLGELAKEHLRPTLWVAVLAVVVYCLSTLLMPTIILGYAFLLVSVFPVSAAIMHGKSWRMKGFSDHWQLAVRYLFLISFVVIVLQLLPLYTIGLVALTIDMLEESVGFVVPFIADMQKEALFVMGTLSYLMFGYSMVVLFVSLTLFHGTVDEP